MHNEIEEYKIWKGIAEYFIDYEEGEISTGVLLLESGFLLLPFFAAICIVLHLLFGFDMMAFLAQDPNNVLLLIVVYIIGTLISLITIHPMTLALLAASMEKKKGKSPEFKVAIEETLKKYKLEIKKYELERK